MQTAGPVWDRTKDVAGDAVAKAAGAAGPAMEKSMAVVGGVTAAVVGTVSDVKDKILSTGPSGPDGIARG